MQILKLENVSKSYGDKVLFKNIDLTISKGDKIAFIAQNGSGKSTLLKVIAGIESSEGQNARIILNKTTRVFYVDQEPDFGVDRAIIDVIFDSDNEKILAIKQYEYAMLMNKSDEIETALNKIEDLNAWNIENEIKEVLSKLNINDISQKVDNLSGGQKKRVALAKMIIDQPEFVILDEPTNHLDIEMIEWLEDYLSASSLTFLMVTHDRYFLERICNQIIELDKAMLFPYKGNYSHYLEKKALRSSIEQTTIDKNKKLFLKELEWINRQPKARRTKAKSRIQDYKVLKEKLSEISFEEPFQIPIESERLGKKIVELYDASFSYGEKKIIEKFWYKFKKGERVGVCGKNGSGKTTLVKLLTGELPLDSGKRVIGSTVIFGHYKQDGLDQSKNMTVLDYVKEYALYIPLKGGHKLSAEKLLEFFMFKRTHQQVYISQLSGGEKKRLHLLTTLIQNPNFLILDEPTNDLDILTLNVLESYLRQFQGCLLIVSHDRYFMDKLVDHLFIMDNGNVTDFNGTYSQWKESKSSKNHSDSPSIKRDIKPEATNSSTDRKLSYLEKQELKNLEKQIYEDQKRIQNIHEEFASGDTDPNRIVELSKELGLLKAKIDEMELRWIELSEFL